MQTDRWTGRRLGPVQLKRLVEDGPVALWEGDFDDGSQARVWLSAEPPELSARLQWRRLGLLFSPEMNGALDHPGVPRVHFRGASDEGHEFLVFAPPLGRSLSTDDLLARPLGERAWVVRQLALLLSAAHGCRIWTGLPFRGVQLWKTESAVHVGLTDLGLGLLSGRGSSSADCAALADWGKSLGLEVAAPEGVEDTLQRFPQFGGRCACWSQALLEQEGWDEDAGARLLGAMVPTTEAIPQATPVLKRPPLVGRAELLQGIREHLLDSSGPPVLILSGEQGAGKRRLLREVLGSQTRMGKRAMVEISERGTTSMRLGLSTAIEVLLGCKGAGIPALVRAIEGAIADEDQRAALRDFLRPSVAEPIGTAAFIEVGEVFERRAIGAVLALFRAVSRHVPLVLVIDDLHDHPWQFVSLLEHLGRSLRIDPAPMHVVVMQDGPPRNPLVHKAMNDWLMPGNPLARSLQVPNLTLPESVEYLVRSVGTGIRKQAQALAVVGDGNPLMLRQIAHAFAEDADRLPVDVPDNPGSVRSKLLQRRLDRFLGAADEGRSQAFLLLGLPSLFGGQAPLSLLGQVDSKSVESGEERGLKLARVMEDAIAAGLIRARPLVLGQEVVLAHPRLASMVLDRIPDRRVSSLRRALAREIGRATHGCHTSVIQVVGPALAAAGEQVGAVESVRLAHDLSVLGRRPAQAALAAQELERQMQSLGDNTGVARARSSLAVALVALGEVETAMGLMGKAGEERSRDAEVVALQRLASRALREGEVEHAEALIARSEALLDGTDGKIPAGRGRDLRTECRRLRAGILRRTGRNSEAASELQDLLMGLLSPYRRALFEDNLAWTWAEMGERRRALSLLDEALDLARRHGVVSVWIGWLDRSRSVIGDGILTAAQRQAALRRACNWGERHCDWRLVGIAACEEGTLISLTGVAGQAEQCFERGLRVARVLDRKDLMVEALSRRAVALARGGDMDSAELALASAERAGADLSPRHTVMSRIWLSRAALLASADRIEACEALVDGGDALERLAWVVDRDAQYCLATIGRCAAQQDKVGLARAALVSAWRVANSFGDAPARAEMSRLLEPLGGLPAELVF